MEHRHYEPIKYAFNHDETRALSEALARANQQVYDLRAEKAASVAAFGAQIKEAEKLAADLTTKLNNGFEIREVECLVAMEDPRPGMKTYIRTDNQERLRSEAMTVQEMQGHFGFIDKPDERPE